jgi:hypothetical protein
LKVQKKREGKEDLNLLMKGKKTKEVRKEKGIRKGKSINN